MMAVAHLFTYSPVARLTLKLFPFYRVFNGYNFRKLCSCSIVCNQWCLLQSKNSFIGQSKFVARVYIERAFWLVCYYYIIVYSSLETINTQNNRIFIYLLYYYYYHRNLRRRFTGSRLYFHYKTCSLKKNTHIIVKSTHSSLRSKSKLN